MKKNNLYLGLIVSIILIVIFYVSYGMLNIGKEEPYYSVSVIVDNSSNDRWNSFKEGLNQGAEENRIHLNIVSTSEFSSLDEECQIISRELENGADGVIVEMCASDDEDGQFSEIVLNKPVVLVDTDVKSSSLFTTVMPDNYRLGEAIAQAVSEGEASSLEGLKIGILGGNQNKLSLQQRLQGVSDVLNEEKAEIAWQVLTSVPAYSQSLEDYIRKNPVDILIALENDVTEWAVDFLMGNKDIRSSLYGEGRSEKSVYYLDKGMIQALIVPNEYYMGYQSMGLMAQKLDQYMFPVENGVVDFLTVTKEKLYDQEIGKILFPVVR